MRRKIYGIISVLLFGLLYLYTAVGLVIVLVLAWLHLKRIVQLIFQLWAKSVFFLIGKPFKVSGRENITKGEKYILVANHGSLFDITAIMSFYPDVAWFGHERLLKIPVFNRILKMTDYVPYKKPTVKNTRIMIEKLKQKSKYQTVAIFPEGTRTLSGRINGFYKGFIYLLRTSDAAILPVTLNGFYRLKPKNRFYIDFNTRLNVVVHKPIRREELINKTDDEIIETVKGVIESAYI